MIDLKNYNKVIAVTRHNSTPAWLLKKGIEVDEVIPHLDVSAVSKGDFVVGNLPVQMAYDVIKKGATYCNLSLDMPFELRGKELTLEEIERCEPKLEIFDVSLRDEI